MKKIFNNNIKTNIFIHPKLKNNIEIEDNKIFEAMKINSLIINDNNENFITYYKAYRKSFVKNIFELNKKFKYKSSIIFKTIIYMDYILFNNTYNNPKQIDLISLCCFILACKYIELDKNIPKINKFIEIYNTINNQNYKFNDIIEYEVICLKLLHYNLCYYTLYDFVNYYFSNGILLINKNNNIKEEEKNLLKYTEEIYNKCRLFIDYLIIYEGELLKNFYSYLIAKFSIKIIIESYLNEKLSDVFFYEIYGKDNIKLGDNYDIYNKLKSLYNEKILKKKKKLTINNKINYNNTNNIVINKNHLTIGEESLNHCKIENILKKDTQNSKNKNNNNNNNNNNNGKNFKIKNIIKIFDAIKKIEPKNMRNLKINNKQKTINAHKNNNKNKIKFLNKSNSQGKIINKSLPKGKYNEEQSKILTQNSLNKNKYNNNMEKNNSKKSISESKNQSKPSNNEKNNNNSSSIFMKYKQFQLNNNLDTGSNEKNNQNLKQSNSKAKLTKNNDTLVNKFNTNINTINNNNKFKENHYSINNYQSFNNYIYIFQKNSRTNSVKIRSPEKDYIFSNNNKLIKNINYDDKDNILQKTIKLFNEHPSPRELNNYYSNNYFNNIINYNKNFYTNKYNNNNNNEHFRLYSFGSFGSELNSNNNINKISYEKKIMKNKSFNNIL